MSTAHFDVRAQLDRAGGPQHGTVTIDRETNTMTVRPRGSRRTYTMPLDVVATMICRATILDELRQKKIARKNGHT